MDLLFLKGRFRTSLDMTKYLANNNQLSYLDMIELLRIRGHIYRFNYMFEMALDIYLSSRELLKYEKSLSHEGKIYTNLAESYCYIDPTKALEYAKKSIEINSKIDANIEIGKAYAAAGISCALLHRFEDALNYAQKGISIQEETGYRSGVLFAKVSMYLSSYLSNTASQDQLDEILQSIYNLQNELNVYSYLLLPVYVITDNRKAIASLKDSIEWLDFDKTLKFLEDTFIRKG